MLKEQIDYFISNIGVLSKFPALVCDSLRAA